MQENIIKKINIFRYCLPLRRPIEVKNTLLKQRTGLIVEIVTKAGKKGCGEIAPLPGFSSEDVPGALRQLSLIKGKLLNREVRAKELDALTLFPSVRYGLETALCDAGALPLCVPRKNKKEISVNALLSVRDRDFKRQLRALIWNGFTSIKVKVHANSSAADRKNIEALNATLARHPRIKLRIDANRKLGLEESVALCRLFDRDQVEYVEEPVSEAGRLREFYKRTKLGFALDESLPLFKPQALKELALSGLKAVVLKPTMLGGITVTLAYIALGKKLGLRPVVSSSYEAGPGFLYALKLASCAGGNIAHGLDTLKRTGRRLLPPGVLVRDAALNARGIKSYRLNRKNKYLRSVNV